MLELLGLGLAAVAAICLLQLGANKTGLPAAALLTVAGLVYALLPGPNLTLHPEIILNLVIPPLIYSAALDSSLLAIRKNLRVVISLSIGLVLATALLTGLGLELAVPGMGLAAGVALGAAVSPTDPVAALAVGGRVGLPARLITIIEGEGLLNDATALTTLTVAVTAATSGDFSLGDAVWHFLLACAGGLVAGGIVAVAVRLARSAVRGRWSRLVLWLCAAAAVVVIGISRVFLGAHYPSDVLGGWCLAGAWDVVVLLAAVLVPIFTQVKRLSERCTMYV